MTETIGEWLENLVTEDTTYERDWVRMQNLLRRVGYPSAVCIFGIVYLEGHGTINCPPVGIHSIARILVEKAKV